MVTNHLTFTFFPSLMAGLTFPQLLISLIISCMVKGHPSLSVPMACSIFLISPSLVTIMATVEISIDAGSEGQGIMVLIVSFFKDSPLS